MVNSNKISYLNMPETLILTEKLGWKVSQVIWKFIAMESYS